MFDNFVGAARACIFPTKPHAYTVAMIQVRARKDTNTMADFNIVQTDDANLIMMRQSGDMSRDDGGCGGIILGKRMGGDVKQVAWARTRVIRGEGVDIDDDKGACVRGGESVRRCVIEGVCKGCCEGGRGDGLLQFVGGWFGRGMRGGGGEEREKVCGSECGHGGMVLFGMVLLGMNCWGRDSV